MQSSPETYLDYLARCEQAFRPFAPIDLPDFFKGRQENIDSLRSELRTAGRQVAIYGERGVGKTSLAALAYFYATFNDETTHVVRCRRDDTYDTIFGQMLSEAGIQYLPNGVETETARAGRIGGGPGSLSRAKTIRSKQRHVLSGRSMSPALLLRYFAEREGLLIIDEYDRVHDAETHTRLAETLKHFSDAASITKIIVVGVAETLTELIGEHESLTRCLAQIKLDRMSAVELGEIIATGEDRIDASFQEDVRRKIIALSDGFPFYTHLLCKYCAEDAGKVLRGNPLAKKVVVSEKEYHRALQRAIRTGEGKLRDDYQAAVITVKRKTDMFKQVLWAVAYSESQEVQVQQIAENVGLLTGQRPGVQGLSNYFGPLTKPEKRNILVRVRQGYYRFANPLMRAYIRLILEEHNLVEANGQLQFPWMRELGVKPEAH